MKLGLNHISASTHIGFGKYGGPIERLLRRPQKMNLDYLYAKFHACRQICTIFPLEPRLYTKFIMLKQFLNYF